MSQYDNNNLIDKWNRLQEALQDTTNSEEITMNGEFKQLLYTSKKRNNQKLKPFPEKQQSQLPPRPTTAISHKTQETFNFYDTGVGPQSSINKIGFQFPISNVTSLKSLMNLRAQARPFSRPGTANPTTNHKDLQVLQSIPAEEIEQLIEKSENIHSLTVDEILDLYTAKCQDTKVEYQPDQASKFIDKIKKNCLHRQFELSNNQLGLESANVLASIFQKNDHFTRLILEKNCISNNGIALIGEALKYNETLIHLNVSSNDIGQEGFAALFESLQENKSIISLEIGSKAGLHRNKLGEKGAEYLEAYLRINEYIQFLNLQSLAISQDALNSILRGVINNQSQSLVYLNLSGNELQGFDTADKLVKALYNTNIMDLDLSNNKLGDEGAIALCNMLGIQSKNYKIEKLNLSSNEITIQGASRMFDALPKNYTIEKLYLDNNFLNGKSFFSIAHMLYENLHLKILSMKNCKIEVEGGDAIGQGLMKNKNLEKLYLNENKLKDQGVIGLVEGLKDNINLLVLELEKNLIDDEGGISLAKILKQENSNLEEINLRENNLHDYAGMILSEAVRINRKIKKMNLERNPISYKFSEDIAKQITMNQLQHKKQEIPQKLSEMEELRQKVREKQNIKEMERELREREQNVKEAVIVTEQHLIETQEQQLAMTRELEEKLEDIREQCHQADQAKVANEEEKNFLIQKTQIELDVLDKKITTANVESNKMQQEIIIKKQTIDNNKLKQSQVIVNKNKTLADLQNKAKTATQSYNSLIAQMEKLKKNIESAQQYINGDEEKNKEALLKQNTETKINEGEQNIIKETKQPRKNSLNKKKVIQKAKN